MNSPFLFYLSQLVILTSRGFSCNRDIFIVLKLQIILYYNFDVVNCEWLTIIYIHIYHFFSLLITLYHVAIMLRSCENFL